MPDVGGPPEDPRSLLALLRRPTAQDLRETYKGDRDHRDSEDAQIREDPFVPLDDEHKSEDVYKRQAPGRSSSLGNVNKSMEGV